MKPIELIDYPLLNSSKPNDIVLDLFGGSGSTLISCEKNRRVCRTMELDPKYCDVIVARWEKFTNKKAVLINGTDSDETDCRDTMAEEFVRTKKTKQSEEFEDLILEVEI